MPKPFILPPPLRQAARPARRCHGLSELLSDYDAFLIDQWGVLHDGHQAYAGAVDCLYRLKQAGKRIVLISNSGKRGDANRPRLEELGFGRNTYDDLVTSGDVLCQLLNNAGSDLSALRGKRCLLLAGSAASGHDHANLPLTFVDQAEEAEFVLLAGIDDSLPQDHYARQLDVARQRGLLLACSNPDLLRLTDKGLQPGTGSLARDYEDAGGKVRFIGKPFPEIYAHCLQRLAPIATSRVLAVGDSLYHDVAGGLGAGLATLLVLGGVHAEALAANATEGELRNQLQALAGSARGLPDWIIPLFRW